MEFKIGQKVFATDRYGSYHELPCTITGFETNTFGQALVRIEYDEGDYHGSTVFYPSELTPED